MLKFLKNVNKWFYAFAIALILCIAAAVTAIVIGLNSQPEPLPEAPKEGPETGVYYYDVEQDEIVLSLNSGNKFTFAGPNLNKSGEYTVSGDTITFDFSKDEDGTASATIENDTLKVTLNGSTLTFLKKVNYTVKYDTDGGSAIADAVVINGKPAVKPDDPVKDGFVFIGWYADSAFKAPFDFDATPVKADTTVYARWAEKSVGTTEYTVSFDQGYEGAPALEAMSTIGGKLYGVPAPEREGYIFAGWFVSMYEDGDKLTAAYTDDTVFTANTTLFAVWDAEGGDKLNAPLVTVTGTTARWNAVAGAVSYKITVTSPDGTELVSKNVGEVMYQIDFGTMPAGDYTVQVTAIASDSAKSSEPAVRYYKNKALDRVSDFQVVNGIFIFNAVENAEKYFITIECGNANHNHTLFDNGNSTTYNFANCTMKDGGIKFTVVASANGYADSVSEVFSYEKKLSAISGVVYKEGVDAFVWDFVKDAAQYKVELTDKNGSYTFTVLTNSFSLANYSGELSVKVTPVTDGYISPAAAEASCKKTAPAAPTGLTVSGMKLSWTATDAAQYEIRIGDQTFTVDTNSFDMQGANINFTVGTVYEATVRAIENGASVGEVYRKYFIGEAVERAQETEANLGLGGAYGDVLTPEEIARISAYVSKTGQTYEMD